MESPATDVEADSHWERVGRIIIFRYYPKAVATLMRFWQKVVSLLVALSAL